MWSHLLSISITKMKKLLSSFTFALSFLFFSFFFSKSKHLIITIILIFTVASPLGIMLLISWSLRWTRLALRISSIHQNQTRAFKDEGGSGDEGGRWSEGMQSKAINSSRSSHPYLMIMVRSWALISLVEDFSQTLISISHACMDHGVWWPLIHHKGKMCSSPYHGV